MNSADKLRKLIECSEDFLQYNIDNVDYKTIVNNLLELSGAGYIVLNIIDHDGSVREKIAAVGKLKAVNGVTNFRTLEVKNNEKKLGEFILFLNPDQDINDWDLLEIYARQMGMFLERLNQEKKSRNNDEKFKSYMENSPYAMFVVDFKKGVISDFNSMALEMTGYSKEELFEMMPEELFSPEDIEDLNNHFKKIFSTGKDYIELEMVKKNRETIIVGASGVKLSDYTIIGFLKDITEEIIINEEVKHMNLMKKTLLDNTDQLFFLIDKNLRIIDYNKMGQFVAKSFYNIDLYIGTDISSLSSEDNREYFAEVFQRAFKGESIKEEISLYDHKGKKYYIEINLNPVVDEDTNEVWALSFTGYNITDLKMTEKALRRSEERFKLAATSTSDIIYELDLKTGKITWFADEDKFQELGLAVYPESLKEWISCLHPEDQDKMALFTREEWLDRKPYSGEYRLIDKKGNAIFVEDYSVGVYDNNVLKRVVGAITNISGRKYYEEQLKYLSYYDQLTEVNNRSFFEEKLKELMDKKTSPVSIIVVDLDGLKLINDTMGHFKGDYQLKSAARIVKESAVENAIISRTGGDEFAIILPGLDEKEAEKILKNIDKKIKKYNEQEKVIPISISSGISSSKEGIDLMEVFKRADDLMYRNKLSKGNSAKSQIIASLMATLAERDYITEGHASRLSEICISVGKNMGLSSQEISNLDLLAKVHDLGKVGIPDNILFKPSSLTEEEWEIMRTHPEKGFRIAISSPDLAGIADLILKHHERWDGKGYPVGISGKEIPLECRILAVADTYDAITNDRPYSKARSREEAIEEIVKFSGTQFDPEIVEVFLEII